MLYSTAPTAQIRALEDYKSGISARLQILSARIARAAVEAGRDPAEVRLLAVSKTWPIESLRDAVAGGQMAFGESYVQEAVGKIEALSDLGLEWHFIGPLQGNKTRPVANAFSWVHSVDRIRIAQRLSEQRDVHLPPLQVCIQVNVSGEESKSGVSPEALPELARAVAALPRLTLRGLMTIPEPSPDVAVQRARFASLRHLRDALNNGGMSLDTLSMGMSDDLEAAIAEGATIVRVGTAIFGSRA
ncbi:YggS family pyridoxal phosphate-dependent enzyme [Zoogloea sp.]|uniref:YggS family pyridoxal phosphate-dependent enzyme n=1 Tax=Zoogloea sp. TaxID=49181 RepID=UPI001AD16A19|nr:YggS family pyridoxal phosphate-dependent enzyme [Zoogloea sp.]MBN8284233.1 YggS family pyridoxal phosphate-dependent enzyme [Zoogloea sp.]